MTGALKLDKIPPMRSLFEHPRFGENLEALQETWDPRELYGHARVQLHTMLLQEAARLTRLALHDEDPTHPLARSFAFNHIARVVTFNDVQRALQLTQRCPFAQHFLRIEGGSVRISDLDEFRERFAESRRGRITAELHAIEREERDLPHKSNLK